MAWCPICKNEYEEADLCPDCSVALLTGDQANYSEVFAFKNEEVTLNIFNYLLEINIPTVQYYYNAATDTHYIICEDEYEADAKQQIIFFIEDKLDTYLTPAQQSSLAYATNKLISDSIPEDDDISPYIPMSDKYTDAKSSASSLIVVGFIGFIILLLDITGIVSFPFSGITRLFFLGTLGVLFIIFIVMGIFTFKNAKKLKTAIDEEAFTIEKIKTFINDQLDLSVADKDFDESTSIEEKCLIRTSYIISKTVEQFSEIEKSLIEYVVEDLYYELYPEDCEFEEDNN